MAKPFAYVAQYYLQNGLMCVGAVSFLSARSQYWKLFRFTGQQCHKTNDCLTLSAHLNRKASLTDSGRLA